MKELVWLRELPHLLSSGERRCDLFGVVFLAMRALLMVALAAPAASAAVDCKMSDWGFCGECTSPCGGGVQECARRVLRPASGGGMACPSKMYRTQQCNTAPCAPHDCQLGDWDCSGAACDRTCGGGKHTCVRAVLRKASGGGKACPSRKARTKTAPCATRPCPIDCVVSGWSRVSACTATCGGGFETRTRNILVRPKHNGKACPALADSVRCNAAPCPLDCTVSAYDPATCGACSKTCGGGIQTCSRTIVREAQQGGAPCPALQGYQPCNMLKPCRQDCQASPFGNWGECSTTCGSGQRFRRRTVVVQPAYGGKACPPMIQLKACLVKACPIDCQVSAWGYYGPCDKTCGAGTRTRHRKILLRPMLGGKPCPQRMQHQKCNMGECPLDCVVSEWGSWETCTHSCGRFGLRAARRTIVRAQLDGGAPCPALAKEAPCNTDIVCPVDCEMHDWSSWTSCTKTCGGGISTRTRAIARGSRGNGKPCPAQNEANQCGSSACPEDCQVTAFDTCSECTKTCGGGTQFCMRSVSQQPGAGGKVCPALSKTRRCNVHACPVDCGISDWNSWSACSASCGSGKKVRVREVYRNPEAGGKVCPELLDTKGCVKNHLEHCPIDCQMTEWKAWSPCTRSCGTGLQTATRDILVKAGNGGEICGDTYKFRRCHTQPCPIDCAVSSFGEWSTCTKSCGGGITTRTRQSLYAAQFFGKACPHLQEERACNTHSCAAPWCHRHHVTCHMEGVGSHAKVVINHHFKFQHVEGKFTCARDNAGAALPRLFEDCKCRCTKHPGCCAKKHYVLQNDLLVGNLFKGVPTKEACCNKCTSHPHCDAWEWSDKHVCVLKKGTPKFSYQTEFETWAGPRAGEHCDGAVTTPLFDTKQEIVPIVVPTSQTSV